jgi:hypothetical protein
MKVIVLHANKQPHAMAERVDLLRATGLVDHVVGGGDYKLMRSMPNSVVPYLIDVNAWTARIAAECIRTRRPWIIDTGDDPGTLARNRGRSRWTSTGYDLVNRIVVGGAVAAVCRGRFHQVLLSRFASGPVHHAPDSVADEILDETRPQGDRHIVGTFGSVAIPKTGDRAYGWEVIDVVAQHGGALTGIIVANGPGRGALEARAKRLGVASDIHVMDGMRMEQLIDVLAPVGFVTSIQSDDLAGWVRTTGKLPLSLGLRKYVVATAVGDVVSTLPHDALIRASDDVGIAAEIATVLDRGIPVTWGPDAVRRAEPFRRSFVAGELARFLQGVQP